MVEQWKSKRFGGPLSFCRSSLAIFFSDRGTAYRQRARSPHKASAGSYCEAQPDEDKATWWNQQKRPPGNDPSGRIIRAKRLTSEVLATIRSGPERTISATKFRIRSAWPPPKR